MNFVRHTYAVLGLLAACGNDPKPRVIEGGGIGDGDIDGTLNVYVIDTDTRQPVADAIVAVGSAQVLTDDTGLAIFTDLSGPQTVVVKAKTYRSTVWQGINGANATVPVSQLVAPYSPQADIMGDISGLEAFTVSPDHLVGAKVGYSQNDKLGDAANHITTSAPRNECFGGSALCYWLVSSRTGTVTLTAAIVDADQVGVSPIGWATAAPFNVEASVPQSKTLAVLDSSQQQAVTIDFGAAPDELDVRNAVIGIELANDEVMQLPSFERSTPTVVPLPSVYAPDATYRLTATAETVDGDVGPRSVVVRRGLTTTTLSALDWLAPPVAVTATRSSASFDGVSGARLYSVQWSDSTGVLLQVTTFDGSHDVTVPESVALSTSNTVTATVKGIGTEIDVKNFSFDNDRKKFWGVASQPIAIP